MKAMSDTSRFRFAMLMTSASTGAEWLSLARRFEDEGYDVVSIPDHLGPQFAPVPALAAIAATTSRVQLSMFVLANDHRHPAVLAKEMTTLDVLSGGRLELGLGAGWHQAEHRALRWFVEGDAEVDFDAPSGDAYVVEDETHELLTSARHLPRTGRALQHQRPRDGHHCRTRDGRRPQRPPLAPDVTRCGDAFIDEPGRQIILGRFVRSDRGGSRSERDRRAEPTRVQLGVPRRAAQCRRCLRARSPASSPAAWASRCRAARS
jgi:alkanesulfonate monooxygenase SsuD/methylene tetrahydromethanopterin reductase-like flavin-dependent oxidoreductase (luciferase family)